MEAIRASLVALDVIDHVLDGADLFRLLVRDLHVVLFLQRHHPFPVPPREATSRASARVTPTTPACAAAYAACPAFPISATTEVRLTIRPYRARTMTRSAALVQWNAPVRLVRSTRSQSSSFSRS